jgi:hypothetical protein
MTTSLLNVFIFTSTRRSYFLHHFTLDIALDVKAIIGNYLVSAKYRILKRLRDKDSLQDQNIKELQEELQKLAEETKIRKIPSYAIVRRRTLTEFWIRNSESTSVLGEADIAKYISSLGEVVLNKGQPISDEMRDQLLTNEIKESETVLILKVKKPDYLGYSRWLFHHDGHPIEASIEDKNWLSAFQNRQVIVRPGDSLKARLRSEIRTGYDSEDILVHHYVTHVIEIIPGEDNAQTFLFPEDEPVK